MVESDERGACRPGRHAEEIEQAALGVIVVAGLEMKR